MSSKKGNSCSQGKSGGSSLTRKKQKVFVCQGCLWRFTSRDKLVEHMLNARDGSRCKNGLHQCPHCGKYWHSEESLDVHLRLDTKCKRAENVPYTISVVKRPLLFNASTSQSNSSNNDNSFDQIKVTHHGSINQPKSVRTSKLCVMANTRSSSQEFLTPELQKFRAAVKESSCRIWVDVHQLVADGTISPKETLVAHLLLNTRFCDDKGILDLNEPFKNLKVEFRNTTAVFSLNGDLKLFPGAETVTSDVEDIDLERFLMNHGTVTTSGFEGHSPLDSNMESTSVGNGSMVFGVVVGSMIIDNTVNGDDDVAGHDTSSHGSGNSRPLLGEDKYGDEEIIDTTMISLQEDVCLTRNSRLFDRSDVASSELFNILKMASAPKYLFDKILNWAETNVSELQNVASFPKRKTFLKHMSNKVFGENFSNCSGPVQSQLVLPSGKEIPITTFSLRTTIASLLMDEVLMNPQNLLINPENQFGCAESGDYLDDINTGWWHRETQAEICSSDNHILLPIIFFIDGATIDKMGKLQVEPISFTLGIFNRQTRKNADAWRTLGYIEDFGNVVNQNIEQNTRKDSSKVKIQDYHAMIEHILRDFQSLQGRNGGFHWKLDWNQKTYNVVFKIAVQAVIGDCKGNDSLCGRYGSHSLQVTRLCWDCRVLTEEADDPMHVC